MATRNKATGNDLFQAAFRKHQQGDYDGAEALYRRVVQATPRHVEAWYLIGSLMAQRGQFAAALTFLGKSLTLNPDFVEAHNNTGVALKELGRLDEALLAYGRALSLRPGYAEGHNNLGVALRAAGRGVEAAKAFRRAAELKPDYAEALNNWGLAFEQEGRTLEAHDCFQRAVAVQPTFAQAWTNLGISLHALGHYGESLRCHDQALAHRDDLAEIHNNRGGSLKSLARFPEAEAAFNRALSLNPDYLDARYNLGIVTQAQGRLDEAIESYDKAIQLNPDYVQAHWNRALAVLLSGDYVTGFADYDWRFPTGIVKHRAFDVPRWNGEPLDSKTLFVHAEQGYGDTFQFVRFLPLVKARAGAGTVIFECQAGTKSQLMHCAGYDVSVERGTDGTPDPATPKYDFHVPLLSLPGVLGTGANLHGVSVPYLAAKSEKVREWRERLVQLSSKKGLKIGIAWAGNPVHQNDKNRSCRLADFAPLLERFGADTTWFSLQKGPASMELAGTTVIDLGTIINTFDDTAAILTELDLVISVDTSLIHLAGALGRPVYAMLAYEPDWRWQLNRADTEWYPTMKLFRQDAPGDWASAFQKVAVEAKSVETHAPKISVVLTTRNQAHLLPEVLVAYNSQTLPKSQYELIVIDDASSDGTPAVLETYSHRRQPFQKGVAAARNLGLTLARGEIIVIANGDCAPAPDFLARHLQAHHQHSSENTAILSHLEASQTASGNVLLQVLLRSRGLYGDYGLFENGEAPAHNALVGGCASFKTALLKRTGGFDETLPTGAEDADLAWRLKAGGVQVCYEKEAILALLEPLEFERFFHKSKTLGRAMAPLAFKYRESELLKWRGVQNAENRLRGEVALAWNKVSAGLSQITTLEELGWGKVAALPDCETRVLPALVQLCEAAFDYHYLNGYLEARQECQDRYHYDTGAQPQMALVSIITACYNYAHFLPEAVQSVLEQTYRNWELIIIDDGSRDTTSEVAEAFIAANPDRAIKLIRHENKGLANSRNDGIQAAQGKYILALDADDHIKPTMLAECVRLLEENPHLGIAVPDIEYFDERGASWIVHARDYDWARLKRENLMGVSSLFRREDWETVGGYRKDCEGAEDWDLWIKLGLIGRFGYRIPKPLFHYRRHSVSLSVADEPRQNYLKAQILLHNANAFDANALRWAKNVRDAWQWLNPKVSHTVAAPTALVSVIVPTYNRPQMLRDALHSVLSQTYQKFEIIVVNDAGENVAPVIDALNDSRVKLIQKAQNCGLSDSRNLGLQAAKGKYIAYLDDDDQYLPEHLETLVSFLENSDYKAAYTDSLRVHQTKKNGEYETTHTDQFWCYDFDYDQILLSNLAPPLCFMHERACIDSVGGFDTTMNTHEDWDLWVRLSRQFDIVHLKKVTCLYTWREDGSSMTSSRKADADRTARLIYERYGNLASDKEGVSRVQSRVLSQMGTSPTVELTAALVKQHKLDLYKLCLCGSGKKLKFCCFNQKIMASLLASNKETKETAKIDIIVVVHNQLEYTRQCIESLYKHTKQFHLLLWDNGSDAPTRDYLQSLAQRGNVSLERSETNLGFIVPNNRLAAKGNAAYLILLNSDTEVKPGWDTALTDYLSAHPETAEVGYQGGKLGPDGVGCAFGTGDEIDYVAGWCACLHRETYLKHGLFNEQNLTFAYGEDSDLSLRLQEAGHKIFALSFNLVTHYGNKTITEVSRKQDTATAFRGNHAYLQQRWAAYLRSKRVLIRAEQNALDVRLIEAESLCASGDWAQAKATLQSLNTEFPAHTRVLNNLGVIYWQEGEPGKALESLVAALNADPSDRTTILNLGDILTALGHVQDAQGLYTGYLQAHPDDALVASRISTVQEWAQAA